MQASVFLLPLGPAHQPPRSPWMACLKAGALVFTFARQRLLCSQAGLRSCSTPTCWPRPRRIGSLPATSRSRKLSKPVSPSPTCRWGPEVEASWSRFLKRSRGTRKPTRSDRCSYQAPMTTLLRSRLRVRPVAGRVLRQHSEPVALADEQGEEKPLYRGRMHCVRPCAQPSCSTGLSVRRSRRVIVDPRHCRHAGFA